MTSKPGVEGLHLYTVPEVAGILRVKKGYVYELIYTGRLRSVRLSQRRIGVTNHQLKQYLEQETQGQAENLCLASLLKEEIKNCGESQKEGAKPIHHYGISGPG